MPETPVTDDALVEEIMWVVSDAMVVSAAPDALVDLRHIARAVLAHLRERGMLAEWRAIDDGAPMDGSRMLLAVMRKGRPAVAIGGWDPHWSGLRWVFDTPMSEIDGPFAYMPLPAAPTGETE